MADTHQAGTAHDGGHSKVFPPLKFDDFAPQIIWLVIVFALLYAVLKRVALPRVGEVIEERAERVRRDLEAAEKLKAETAQALANYEQALAEARAKASGIVKDMRDKLAAEIDAERAKVEAQINEKLAQAEKTIADTKTKALASVDAISAEVAGDIVSRLSGGEVSRADVEKALAQQAAE
ncbi:MAG: F0F1 ATP synthase subunit B' [Hyphomicrobiales bacterium]|jgi:F-type H+-transporting ATPase subunit b|nr:MAG: F0F1 ATP synthase subunit B' [Hyphomicrobiales bacterium]